MIRINEAACSAIEALSNNVKQNIKEKKMPTAKVSIFLIAECTNRGS
jgi:hypothetical protein